MLRVLAFGAAAGAGIQAWRAIPPDGPISAGPAALLFAVGVLCAYLGGRWHGRGRYVTATATAVAAASADAVAVNTVNVAVLVPGSGAGSQSQAEQLEAAPWFGAPRPAITADDLDGIDLADVFDMQESAQHEIA